MSLNRSVVFQRQNPDTGIAIDDATAAAAEKEKYKGRRKIKITPDLLTSNHGIPDLINQMAICKEAYGQLFAGKKRKHPEKLPASHIRKILSVYEKWASKLMYLGMNPSLQAVDPKDLNVDKLNIPPGMDLGDCFGQVRDLGTTRVVKEFMKNQRGLAFQSMKDQARFLRLPPGSRLAENNIDFSPNQSQNQPLPLKNNLQDGFHDLSMFPDRLDSSSEEDLIDVTSKAPLKAQDEAKNDDMAKRIEENRLKALERRKHALLNAQHINTAPTEQVHAVTQSEEVPIRDFDVDEEAELIFLETDSQNTPQKKNMSSNKGFQVDEEAELILMETKTQVIHKNTRPIRESNEVEGTNVHTPRDFEADEEGELILQETETQHIQKNMPSAKEGDDVKDVEVDEETEFIYMETEPKDVQKNVSLTKENDVDKQADAFASKDSDASEQDTFILHETEPQFVQNNMPPTKNDYVMRDVDVHSSKDFEVDKESELILKDREPQDMQKIISRVKERESTKEVDASATKDSEIDEEAEFLLEEKKEKTPKEFEFE